MSFVDLLKDNGLNSWTWGHLSEASRKEPSVIVHYLSNVDFSLLLKLFEHIHRRKNPSSTLD